MRRNPNLFALLLHFLICGFPLIQSPADWWKLDEGSENKQEDLCAKYI